jgi:protein SCO1/2
MKIKWTLVTLVAVPLAVLAIFLIASNTGRGPIEILGTVHPFELVERSGKSMSREDLKGKVWIANFIFTHCGQQCPQISGEMKRLQKRFSHKDNLRLVTFTVDPERDSAQELSEYAQKWGADPKKWLFLTGKKNDLQNLIQNGFHLSAGEPLLAGVATAKSPDTMTHSMRFVLVDAASQIRGYYDGMDGAEVKHLLSDTKRLLKESF